MFRRNSAYSCFKKIKVLPQVNIEYFPLKVLKVILGMLSMANFVGTMDLLNLHSDKGHAHIKTSERLDLFKVCILTSIGLLIA